MSQERPSEYSPQGWVIYQKRIRENLEGAKEFIDADRIKQPEGVKKDGISNVPSRIEIDLQNMNPSGTVVDNITHAKPMVYKVPENSPVFVANTKMVLKKHMTKKTTLFSREQLVIGEKMKHWQPFEFAEPPKESDPFGAEAEPPVTATPTQLFDLGWYTFETDNKKWPWMVVSKSVFDDKLKMNSELARIKEALTKSRFRPPMIDMKKWKEQEKNAEHIENLRKHLGAVHDERSRWEQQNTQKFTEEDVDKLAEVFQPASKPQLTEKQQKQMKKKSKCPDCGNTYWQGGPCAGGCQNMKCKNCGSEFNVTPLGVERL